MHRLQPLKKPLRPKRATPPLLQQLEPRRLFATNLLANGGFNQGSNDFTTGLSRGGSSLIAAGSYVVGFNPHKFHWAAANFGDHTTGDTKMLIINGSSKTGAVIW